MDRAIKFRFWRDNEMQMAHQLNAYDDYNFAGDGEILMEFTGLYDCEGKEIYEGDIVKWFEGSNWNLNGKDSRHVGGIIKYGKGGFIVDANKAIKSPESIFNIVPTTILLIHTNATWGLEVIGNLYEHPQLLNNKSNT